MKEELLQADLKLKRASQVLKDEQMELKRTFHSFRKTVLESLPFKDGDKILLKDGRKGILEVKQEVEDRVLFRLLSLREEGDKRIKYVTRDVTDEDFEGAIKI